MTEQRMLPHPPEKRSGALRSEADIPRWLLEPSAGGSVSPPVQTSNQLLPLGELAWEDFERPCLKIMESELVLERASLYGMPGQRQRGIDVYAVDPAPPKESLDPRPYVTQ